ncbi:helix-turn-helix domain-containing protein [Pelosinus propionicus]|uniref:DNA binding domain-containing protein, excisionase family n=1 Tax=Pelosinus propionicus DSM 13327 TaxID=1123291 RepID=A0A1I4QFU2_9FIRM|nr:helix-turn-helix domain-containing protein [Pelosinus propionicus]SFM38510.1 DNA binding domain-containing protein, excisionase family [Pelosinus propionicus DSM 13327]
MAEIEGKLQQLGIEIIEGAIDRQEYFSVKEAAEMLNCTTKTIRNRIERKELKAVYHKIGIGQSQYLIPKEEINIATITTEVIPVSRAISIGELKEAIKAEMRAENAQIREELSVVRETQERIEKSLQERDARLLEAIRERQHERQEQAEKPWWKFWE